MSADRPVTKEDVAVLLTSALGQDKSDEVVSTAARSLGFVRGTFSGEEIRAIFERLVKSEGLVGVVARFAVSRGDVDELVARAPQRTDALTARRLHFEAGGRPLGGASSPSPSPASIDLMPLLAPALGAEKARDAIVAAAARRGVDIAAGLSQSGALEVLDEMARIEGIVGVVARFAKARFLLNPG